VPERGCSAGNCIEKCGYCRILQLMSSTDTNGTEAAFEGGCACGSVRYRMQSQPLFVHCCHCSWCQRETGASYALNALIEGERVRLLEGEPEMTLTPSNSGKGQKIWRCPKCHVALWSNYAGFGDNVSFVRVGTLDEAGRITPDIHIFTASKQPWVVIPDGSDTAEEFYSLKEYWPDSSRARLRQVLGQKHK
jgi:hypothetical protein